MYPNPYFRPSLLNRGLNFTRAINWGGLLDGTQKTLGVINQAIPIVYQVKPIINNARTMFRIADEIKKPDHSMSSNHSNQQSNYRPSTSQNENKPIFYI